MRDRKNLNQEIKKYWETCKKTGIITYQSIGKKKIPTFTRHNGLRLLRLKRSGWRFPRSTQGNRATITKPLIGYKNPQATRHCLKAYGKRIKIVYNERELTKAVKDNHIPVLGRTLGGRSRERVYEYAKANQLPLMLRR